MHLQYLLQLLNSRRDGDSPTWDHETHVEVAHNGDPVPFNVSVLYEVDDETGVATRIERVTFDIG